LLLKIPQLETVFNPRGPARRTPQPSGPYSGRRKQAGPLSFDTAAPKETLPTMKRICFLLVFALIWAAAAAVQAQTVYISDVFEVTLRTGPGIDHKIVAMLRSGEPMTIIEEGEEWTRVEIADGRQGYVLNRFISPTPPARLVLERLRTAHDNLQSRATELEEANRKLVSENRSLQQQLEETRKELSTVQEQFTTLKSESSDFFTLKTRYERAATSLRSTTERVNELEAEVSRLQLNKNIRWFLSGAGVLVLGFLIGFSTKKQRRKSSLL
jgi:SH3 domain protein